MKYIDAEQGTFFAELEHRFSDKKVIVNMDKVLTITTHQDVPDQFTELAFDHGTIQVKPFQMQFITHLEDKSSEEEEPHDYDPEPGGYRPVAHIGDERELSEKEIKEIKELKRAFDQ